jgi:hypothetical protein
MSSDVQEGRIMKRRVVVWVLVGLMLAGVTGCPVVPPQSTWAWEQRGDVLEIAYGNAVAGWPQMAALHVNTSALRMVYGPDSGWGPTVYLAPSLWTNEAPTGEQYHLGASVTHTVSVQNGNLVLDLTGVIGGLGFATTVRFSAPGNDSFEAHVSTATSGSVTLADRPSEAFKPVHVASMHISDTQWDTSVAHAGATDYAMPAEGWIVRPPGAAGSAFTLVGGSSVWKPNAPTIAITLDRTMTLQGWIAVSVDPNDDNVGFWAATDAVLASWAYDIAAMRPAE